MENQKICIIGGGLTGLITALSLSKLNLKIDLIPGNINQNLKSNRTTAISQNNYEYLNKLNSFKFSKNEFWPCSQIKLYTETKKKDFTEVFELNDDKKKIFYIMENSKIIKYLIKEIKKNKLISFEKEKKVYKISNSGLLKSAKFNNNSSKYNLIIICTGINSDLVKKIFPEKSFNYSYDEISITATLDHSPLKNNIARQIFLDHEILALLPISNTRTSIVWSVKKNKMKEYIDKNLIHKKIRFYTKKYLKNLKFINGIEQKNLNFFIREKYCQDRVLLFGDALHAIHPFVGQSFNMTLRDLITLEKTLKNKINLGLDIGSSNILTEFSHEIKSRNFVFSLGVDFIKKFFSLKEEPFKIFRNTVITKLNKNRFAKNIFFDLANKGFKF